MAIADSYEKGKVLGSGTFGEVIEARHKETGEQVAIKKIRVEDKKQVRVFNILNYNGLRYDWYQIDSGRSEEHFCSCQGVHVTALREVKYLKELHHPNIVNLIDVIPLKRGIALVFEYMQTDLENIIKDRTLVLSAADVKAYMQFMLRAVEHCHKCWVVHRDIKPNNFLISGSGEIKLTDFGLARIYGSPERRYTNQVFARWYRAPELFYGSTCYGPGVDIWALGCIFAELLMRKPWFVGESDVEVLSKIFAALGTPTDAEWAGLKYMPGFVAFQETKALPLVSQFPGIDHEAIDLLSRMVCLDPRKRITASSALKHSYFKVKPAPTEASKLPRPHIKESHSRKRVNGENGRLWTK